MTTTAKTQKSESNPTLLTALRTLDIEAAGLNQLAIQLAGPIAENFLAAIAAIKAAQGRVIVSGMGKSGQIGRKIASTLASTGTPALYLHPGDASHGDLGMITEHDVLLVLSWSGETRELKDMVAYSRRFTVPLIAITSKEKSTLAKAADVVLTLPRHEEACPNGLAPTTSTTMQLVLGDALAVSLLEDKGFTPVDFRTLHPGGKLGAALSFVRDIMHEGDGVPVAPVNISMPEALLMMTEKSMGCLGLTDDDGKIVGIITDGDLRRHMSEKLLQTPTSDIMTVDPITIGPDELASSALELINNSAITSLFVTENKIPVGIIHIHDLLRLGVA